MTSSITQQQLGSYLWGAATLLRGHIDEVVMKWGHISTIDSAEKPQSGPSGADLPRHGESRGRHPWLLTSFPVRGTADARHRLSATGEGAERAGGRWNSPGVPVVYASEHKSLAVLEMLVHLDPQEAVRYVTFRVEFDETLVERCPADRLPSGWRAEVPARASLPEAG